MTALRSVLEEVRDGRTSFEPVGTGEQEMREFQPIAKMLAYANRQGFLENFVPHKESQTGNDWYDLVVVSGGLTFEGEEFLSAPDPAVEERMEEIIQLKPNIYGVGIDLNALWRRWKNGKT